jgi:hypothetical protein
MASCAARRFGPGTPCTKTESETGATKELATRLQQLQKEREEMDSIWKPVNSQTQIVSYEEQKSTHVVKVPIPQGKTRGF